jgi:hypothetical protein
MQAITVIERIKAERRAAERQGLADDVAVLSEEIQDARLVLLKLRWKETSNASLYRP